MYIFNFLINIIFTILINNYCMLYIFTGLFWRIHLIDLYSNLISFVLVTLASTYALALAYKNTKFILKHKVYTYIFTIYLEIIIRIHNYITIRI